MFNVSGTFSSFSDFADAINGADEVMFKHMSRAYFKVGDSYRQFHRAARLNGRPGLNTVSRIGLNRSSHTEVGGTNIGNLSAITFFSGLVTKYVNIHEYGGTIVPVKAKYLKFKIDGQWIMTKSVYIPPRLKWFDGWDRYAEDRDQILGDATEDALQEIAK